MRAWSMTGHRVPARPEPHAAARALRGADRGYLPLPMDDESDHFGEEDPFTLGVEEELFVVERPTGALRNDPADVREQLGDLDRGDVESELHRSQIELITGVCHTVAEAMEEIARLRT